MGNSNAARFKDVSPAVAVKGMASGFAQNIAAGQHQLTSESQSRWAAQIRTITIRSVARGSRVLHVDDSCLLCQTETVAA